MIKDRTIICIASDWHYDPTSKHQIMKRLARHNRVLWVNYHGSRQPRASAADARAIAGKLRKIAGGAIQVEENITVMTPLVLPMPGRASVARINSAILTRQIRRELRKLPPQPVQLWSFAPDVDYLVGRFDEECVVYYCVDEFSEFSGYDRQATLAAEQRLASKADLVITTSQRLFDAKQSLNPRAVLVTHGVDYDHFADVKARADASSDDTNQSSAQSIQHLSSPILGFWGLIQDWVDIDLLENIARFRPNWSIVLVGDIQTDVSKLRPLANIHFLGRRSYANLPALAAGFDAAMIPFRINDLTRAVNPIKLREFLSAGLPVVSTPLPEVECYRALVRIADNAETFANACEEEIRDNSEARRQARRQAMKLETWESKIELISRELDSAMSGQAFPRDALVCIET